MALSVSFALLFLFLALSWAVDCNIDPIYIDLHLRAVHGTEAFEYGSFVGFGSPAQNQSLWASITSNETSVADTDFCKHSRFPNCANSTGGFFDISESETWKNETSYRYKNVDEPNNGVFGEDTIHLYTHFFQTDPAWETTFTNQPLKVVKNGSARPDTLGLGPQSTLLQNMYDANMISSRSYGFYVGTGFDRAHGVINGSLVFGGYDAARFEGPVHTYNLSQDKPNPFQVNVTSIRLHDADGQGNLQELVVNSGFNAGITTEQYPIRFPYDITERFKRMVSTEPAGPSSTSNDNSLRVTAPSFNGTMIITLSDGLVIKLAPEVVANVSGIAVIQDDQNQNSSRGTEEEIAPVLGSSFLSQVYFMANYDNNTFHLAQAVPEAKFITTKTMCPDVVPSPYISSGKSGFLSSGAIGGIVGGVISGSAILLLATCFCLRWRRRRTRKRVRYFDGTRGGVKIHEYEYEAEDDSDSDGDDHNARNDNGKDGDDEDRILGGAAAAAHGSADEVGRTRRPRSTRPWRKVGRR